LSIKQLAPTDVDEYLAELKVGDTVSGRIVEQSGGMAVVELAEGVRATCELKEPAAKQEEKSAAGAVDLSSLTSALAARWKGQTKSVSPKSEAVQVGQVRSFRVVGVDREAKQVKVELA